MPSVITANDLHSGAVVYLDDTGTWVRELSKAAAIASDVEHRRLEAQAQAAVEGNAVTAVYAFDVRVADGAIEPISVRERIRAANAITS